MSRRSRFRGDVAFAGAATTGFVAKNSGRSRASLAAQACTGVLADCGLTATDVDGICASVPGPAAIQSMLGIPAVTWSATHAVPFLNHIVAAAAAVHSGLCEVVLAVHVAYRLPWNTPASLADPFRRSEMPPARAFDPDTIDGGVAYAAWAARYLDQHGSSRNALGRIAINGRNNAARNPGAAKRDPISMDDYQNARMIRWPLGLLDMDIAVDGADAFVITTAERARDLPFTPVLIDAAVLGTTDHNEDDQIRGARHGQHIVAESLRTGCDVRITEADVVFPYDGFSIIAVNWLESLGFCPPGGAEAFIDEHWDEGSGRILIGGRAPVNPHGGSLSEGATQGSGHVREAVHQLQGRADGRQVPDARTAIVAAGGFSNAQGITLRRD